jgi:hypothetical protein
VVARMKVNTGKGCSNYDPAEERRQIKNGKLPKAKPLKKPTKLKGQCPHCGMVGK